MMPIPPRLFHHDTVHRSLTADPFNGLLSCGFLHKQPATGKQVSDIDLCFDHYGGLLILSGTGVHTDSAGQSWPLSPGCFVQRLPGRRHSTLVHPDGAWLEFFICIGRDLFESLVRLRVLDDRHEVLHPGMTPALLASMEALLSEMKEASDSELPLSLAHAQQILFSVLRMDRQAGGSNDEDDWVDRACRLMAEISGTQDGQMRVEAIAEKVGIGYERFRKGFRVRTGLSPAGYLRMRRMNAAQSLLANGNRSIADVAETLGFPDAFTFSKQFHRTVGISPSRFRTLYAAGR